MSHPLDAVYAALERPTASPSPALAAARDHHDSDRVRSYFAV